MSSVTPGIYISRLVPFALGSYKFNTIERAAALHRETLHSCFVIFITTSQVDFTAGFQINPNINWHHDDVMTWLCFPQ